VKILTRNKIYEDLKQKENDLEELMIDLNNKNEDIVKYNTNNSRLCDELENVYATLKTIKETTKDKTIETLCILKMQDIKNISGVYVYDN